MVAVGVGATGVEVGAGMIWITAVAGTDIFASGRVTHSRVNVAHSKVKAITAALPSTQGDRTERRRERIISARLEGQEKERQSKNQVNRDQLSAFQPVRLPVNRNQASNQDAGDQSQQLELVENQGEWIAHQQADKN